MSRRSIVFKISLLLTSLWIILVIALRSTYLNSRSIDPLAMVHTLFPFFWLLLLGFLCLSIATVTLQIGSRSLYVLLLFQISLTLYCTPIFLSGFYQNPDSLWHAAIGISIPEVLSGERLMFSDYGKAFPLTYILIYSIIKVTGADILTYILYIQPILGAATVTLLGYTLASKFLNQRNAFVSMLFALPALHYLQFHMSPQFVGFSIVLVTIAFLSRFNRKSMAVALSLMFLLVATHISSPLILGAYIFAIYVYKLLTHDVKLPLSAKPMLFLGLTWLYWLIYYVEPVLPSVKRIIARTATLDFSKSIRSVRGFMTLGGGFIYPEISALSQFIYISYAVIAFVPFFLKVARARFKQKPLIRFNEVIHSFTYKETVPVISALLFLVFSYGILMITTEKPDQFIKSFTFFILMISICIGSYNVLSKNSKLRQILVTVWLVFVYSSFPIVSYSTAAYDTVPPSEGKGMIFITSFIPLNGKIISMYLDRQLAAYTNTSQNFRIVDFPPALDETLPDVIGMRKTSFFRIAMRFDLSFETNQFTELQSKLAGTRLYNKVYSSPTFGIYVFNSIR